MRLVTLQPLYEDLLLRYTDFAVLLKKKKKETERETWHDFRPLISDLCVYKMLREGLERVWYTICSNTVEPRLTATSDSSIPRVLSNGHKVIPLCIKLEHCWNKTCNTVTTLFLARQTALHSLIENPR